VVQEEGSHRVLVYLAIPELRVERKFRSGLKKVPINAETTILHFDTHAFTFSMTVQTKKSTDLMYMLKIDRLAGEIVPERCTIKYQRGGVWLTLYKEDTMSWMNRICDPQSFGLNIPEEKEDNKADDDFSSKSPFPAPSAPPASSPQVVPPSF
ncbi:unnamed protein product, partial [Didymodactylos carnosus]